MEKAYLDFQIFDLCSKDSNLKRLLITKPKFNYFCSTAHLEELYRATSNANTKENEQKAAGIKSAIEEICVYGVLNPGKEGIILKSESLEDCLFRIRSFDTREAVYNNAIQLKKAHTQPSSFSSAYYDSPEKWLAIWNEPQIEKAISDENSEVMQRAKVIATFNQICPIYGVDEALRQARKYHLSNTTKIQKGCYTEINASYDKLERIIEALSRILSRYGYYRDKGIRKFNSGEYDITHMIVSY